MKVTEESEKVGLKLNIQKTGIMESGPITSRQIGKQWKQWQILFWGSPKSLQLVTAAMKLKDACSLEESYDQPRQHINSRDITLPIKIHLVKAMVFPIVMYGCESWTIKKAEHWRIDAFELWCWRRLLKAFGQQGGPTVHPKGNRFWIFVGKTDAEAETPKRWTQLNEWTELITYLGKKQAAKRSR